MSTEDLKILLAGELTGLNDPAPFIEEFIALAFKPALKWSLIKLKWTNYYRYDSGYIDFTLPGLRGVIAPNCSGKSSIIDIILLALFNTPRGRREDAIRSGTVRAELELIFEVGGITYTLKRDDTAAKMNIVLDSIDNTVSGPRAVYAALTSLVGDRDTFMLSNVYNSSADIFAMTPLARQRALPALLGLADCDDFAAQWEAAAKTAAAKLNALKAPRINALINIAELENQRAESIALPADRWRFVLSITNKPPPAAPIPCEPEDLVPRPWPLKDLLLSIKSQGVWPSADMLAGPGLSGDILTLWSEYKGLMASRARVRELSGNFTYADNCECCARTRGILQADLAAAVKASSAFNQNALDELLLAIVAEVRAEKARGADNFAGKYAYAVEAAAAENRLREDAIAAIRKSEQLEAAIRSAREENKLYEEYNEKAPALKVEQFEAATRVRVLHLCTFKTPNFYLL